MGGLPFWINETGWKYDLALLFRKRDRPFGK